MGFKDIIPLSTKRLASPTRRRSVDPTRRLLRTQILTREELIELGSHLAADQRFEVERRASRALYTRLRENCADIEEAYRILADSARKKEALTPGAEWLLDNYHVIEKQITDIRKQFPKGYDRTLPKIVEGEFAHYPRVYQIALEFITHSDSVLDLSLLNSLLEGYQTASVLTMGEVWAVPIMLRFALLDNLRNLAISMLLAKDELRAAESLVDEILGDETRPGTQILLSLAEKVMQRPDFLTLGAAHLIRRLRDRGRKASLTLQWLEERLREEGRDPEEILKNEQYIQASDQISIGNIFTSLRAIGFINWSDWFESTNRVEHLLRLDPGRLHPISDFKTRDLARHYVEELSRRVNRSQTEVAEAAVTLAREHQTSTASPESDPSPGDVKRSSVGYYFQPDNQPLIEKHLGYRPGLLLSLSRSIKRRAFIWYSASILLIALALLFAAVRYSAYHGASIEIIIIIAIFAMVPALDIAGNLVQWIVTHITRPGVIPKLDLDNGIPDKYRTIVAVQAIFADTESVKKTIDSLYVRSLANDDDNILFAVLADLPDHDEEIGPKDKEITDYAADLIAELNATRPSTRFFVFFRKRLWNERSSRFMGWERKRGKIEEFNRLLLGDEGTTFIIDNDEKKSLRLCRYVITLDNDTQLPRGTARRLVAAAAHPLNAPILNPVTRTVVEGYGLIQPRVGVSLTSANSSLFALTFSGHAGLDPYTQTVSDVYQDLFGEGSFIGKGIYDIRAFDSALRDRVPENALLSHDLFEGLFVRVALASDIELFDDFPSKYHVHAKRQHRWIRGDWQLLPFTGSSIENASHQRYRTPISDLGRWKLLDNLRRSLVAPSMFAMFVGSWSVLPGNPLFWIFAALVVISFPVYTNLAQAIISPPRGLSMESHLGGLWRDVYKMSRQAFYTFCFLPHQAYLSAHAIILTLYRIYISKRNLLQWETAYHAERRLGYDLKSFFVEMGPAIVLAGVVGAAAYTHDATSAFFSVPCLICWISGPFIARQLSLPKVYGTFEIPPVDREYLYEVAHSTWRYFHDLLNERNNFLIPDNIQLVPERIVAERTSPTNISLSILTTISAYDFGFISLFSSVRRVYRTFLSLSKLERFNGHFLNWYGTATLEGLHPRYVSMVDSGNMVGHLIALNTALNDSWHLPIVGTRHLAHISRSLTNMLNKVANTQKTRVQNSITKFDDWQGTLSYRTIFDALREISEMRSFLIEQQPDAPDFLFLDESNELIELLPLLNWLPAYDTIKNGVANASVSGIAKSVISATLDAIDDSIEHQVPTLESMRVVLGLIETVIEKGKEFVGAESIASLFEAHAEAKRLVQDISETIQSILDQAEEIVSDMDFSFLYDYSKDLFVIGYNVDAARKDGSYYDLLASEARLGSLVAVSFGQIPQKHWFSLGRGLTSVEGGKALLSWTGTMFEYLMPLLVMKDFPGTLLSETYDVVVKTQKAYASRFGVPWGISESGYSGVDFEKTYQYKAFGVPGLGLKRGLEDDLVISPYSTLLALQIDPKEAIKNSKLLEKEGLRGDYGFYEAIDYTTSRLAANEKSHVVQNFLAHHQGMSVVAINNVLHAGIWQERFHRDPRIQSSELLLHEKFPERLPALLPQQIVTSAFEEKAEESEDIIIQSIPTPHTAVARTHLLSNGRYTVMVDNAGSGFSILDREIALTRWREDSVSHDMGSYIYFRDLDSNQVWSPTFQPTLVEPQFYEAVYVPDKAEFKRRDFEIYSHLEITVSPEDNVEVRRITLANLSDEHRSIEVTTFGEVALAPIRADSSHPAFSKMFVESQFLEEFDALLFSRRPRSKHEERLYFLHMVTMKTVWDRTQYETSRELFIGRGGTVHNPHAFRSHQPLSGAVGYVLDPIFSLRVRVELEPGESQVVTFVSTASKSKDEIMTVVSRFRDHNQVSRAFEMAWSQSSIELRNERTYGKHGHTFQKLANALMLNVERMRSKPDIIMRNRMGQSGLWRFGISGDLPICLVRVTEPNQMKLVEECLQAHHYLRNRGFQFDLVVFNEYPGGYLQNAQEELEFMVRSSLSGGLVDKKGGIFLRSTLQLSEEEKDLVQAVARVSLSGLRGPLAAQLKVDEGVYEWLPYDPRHTPVYSLSARDSNRDPGEFGNGIGAFTQQGRAYTLAISNDKLPPSPWSNVIATSGFGTLISETGGGYSWSDNSRENRLTPWSNDPICDPLGEVVYIRDSKSGAYWCPTPRPVLLESEVLVTHRFGATDFKSTVDGITSELTITIAPEEKLKWWGLTLSNLTPQPRTLEVFLYVDWVLGVARNETYTQIVTSYDKSSGALFATNHYNTDFPGRVGYVGSSRPIETYTSSKVEFVGRNRDLSSPYALESIGRTRKANLRSAAKFSHKIGACFDPCAVIKVTVNIEPNGSEQVAFFLGEAPSIESMRTIVGKNVGFKAFQSDLEGTLKHFDMITSNVQVSTPERGFDILMNGWLLYQTLSCRLNGRTGFFQSGGAFGFRDQLQDCLSFVYSNPAILRRQILLHASRQFPEGDVQHWWHPPTGKGVRTRISDDYLWLPYAVERYIDATGDLSILEEQISFIDGPLLGDHEMEAYIVPHSSPHQATLYEHCLLALDRSFTFGVHGLPLIGGGDWNDGMNEIGRNGKGESVWLGWFIALILKRFAPIVEARGDSTRGSLYREKIIALKEAIEANAWDGKWYRRAYFDDGTPVGSASNDECRIDSLSQTWSIISELGDKERSVSAMKQVYDYLVDTNMKVIKLLTPPFDAGSLEPGYIKGYLPGIRENGGQYTHAAAWVIIATAMAGDGTRATEYFKLINPIHHTDSELGSRKYRGEPYVLCGDVYTVAPHEGRAGWSWYTGSSGWLYQAGLEHILGLRIRSDHFTVDPCIPNTWKRFEFRYTRNKTTYRISVENTAGVEKGVRSIEVGKTLVPNNRISYVDSGEPREVEVRVVMG